MNWLKERWRSVPLQIIALTVLPLTILIFAIAVGSLSLHRQAMRELVGERDARATQAAASAITEQLNFRLTAVRSLARQANGDNDPDHVLADAAYFLPNFDGGLALFEPDGRLIQSTGDTPFWQSATIQAELNRIRHSPAFQRDPRALTTLVHPQTEQWQTLVVSTLAEQPDGILAVGAFSPVALANRTLRDLFQADGVAAAFLVDENGRLLYQTGSLPHSHDNLSNHPGISEALQGNSGTLYLDVPDAEHVAAYSPIPPVGWALVIEEPWASVSDPLLEATEFTP